MALSQKGAGYLRRNNIVDPNLRQALDDLASQIANVGAQVNAATQGNTLAPPQISSLSVTAAGGIFDAVIQDNNPVSRGIEYFLEYSLTPVGPWTVVSLGPSRGPWRGTLGNQTLYWRGYSQYPTSAPSAVVYFGGAANPTAVVGGGTAAGPAPQPSAGSGTAPTNGLSGGQGYGSLPTRPIPEF
jgi:hypothetical protein